MICDAVRGQLADTKICTWWFQWHKRKWGTEGGIVNSESSLSLFRRMLAVAGLTSNKTYEENILGL